MSFSSREYFFNPTHIWKIKIRLESLTLQVAPLFYTWCPIFKELLFICRDRYCTSCTCYATSLHNSSLLRLWKLKFTKFSLNKIIYSSLSLNNTFSCNKSDTRNYSWGNLIFWKLFCYSWVTKLFEINFVISMWSY